VETLRIDCPSITFSSNFSENAFGFRFDFVSATSKTMYLWYLQKPPLCQYRKCLARENQQKDVKSIRNIFLVDSFLMSVNGTSQSLLDMFFCISSIQR
jgi:hypothetical protein